MSDQAQANICESHHFVWTWPINDPGHGSIGVCDLCGAVKVDECRPMRDPMTGDDLAEKVAAVLGAHVPHVGWGAGAWNVECLGCTFTAHGIGGVGDANAAYRRHLAAALVPLIREREAAASFRLSLTDTQRVVDHLIHDGTRDGLILGNLLNAAMGASARRRAAANPYAGSEGA